MVFPFRLGDNMFYTLPTGQVINKNQIVKIDQNSQGDVRLVMTGNITVTLRNTTIEKLLEIIGE